MTVAGPRDQLLNATARVLQRLRRSSRALACVLAYSSSGSLTAVAGAPQPAPGAAARQRSAASASPRRTLPDYDGREEPPPTGGDALLWIARVVLFPAYFVSEVLIRRPLGSLIAGAERAGVPAALYDFFTFGEQHQAGVVPTAYADFDFYPSVGLYAFWNDAFYPGHDLRLRAAFGGEQWLALAVSERFPLSSERTRRLVLEAALIRRPDYTYFGLGPDTRQAQLSRYGQDLLEARVLFDQRAWRSSALRAKVVLRSVEYRQGGFDGDPTLEQQVARGRLPLPPGYASGYDLLWSELGAALDTRQPAPLPGSGARVGAGAGYAFDLRERGGFVRYGAGASVFWDLNQRQRVLSLALTARFADPIAGGVIPFGELISLGGSEPMRGLYPGRLYDRSALVLDLGYRWPIWVWLDGALHSEVGNVFGARLEGFQLQRLRWSGAIGVESKGTPDSSFQLLIGVGSETFESGGKLDSVRVAAGVTSGF